MTPIQQVAAACGVTEADVLLFARLTATQLKNGLEPVEAVEAAHATSRELCHRAFRSISKHDPTNEEFGHRDQFLPAIYELLTA